MESIPTELASNVVRNVQNVETSIQEENTSESYDLLAHSKDKDEWILMKGCTAKDNAWEPIENTNFSLETISSIPHKDLSESINERNAETDFNTTINADSKELPKETQKISKKFYEVEKIMAYRRDENGEMVLLRWKGYTADDDTWESIEHCNDALLDKLKQLRASFKNHM